MALIHRTMAIGWPVIAAQSANMLLAQIDLFMVSRISVPAVAAVGVASTYMNFWVIIVGASGFGTGLVVARELGRPRRGRAGDVTRHGLILGPALGMLVGLVGWLTAPWVMRAMGLTGDVLAMAEAYASVFWMALPAIGGSAMASSALAAHAWTRHVFIASILMLIVNTLGDYALIFGNFGAPALGVAGAAWASVAAAWTGWIWLLFAMLRHHDRWGPSEKHGLHGVWKTIRAALPYATSASMEWLLWFGAIFALTIMLARAPTEHMAVFHVNLKLQQLFMLGLRGSLSANQSMIGRAYGQGSQPRRIQMWHRHTTRLGLWMIAPGAILMLLFPEAIYGIFLPIADVKSVAAPRLLGVLMAVTVVVRTLNSQTGSTLRSVGVIRYFIILTGVSQVFMLALAYGLVISLSMFTVGAMIASLTDESVRVLINRRMVHRKIHAPALSEP